MKDSMSATQMLQAAKAVFDTTLPGQIWDAMEWDIQKWLPVRRVGNGIIKRLWLTYPNCPRGNAAPIPFPRPYGDVVRALVLLYWGRSRCGASQLNLMIGACRILIRTMIEQNCPTFTHLTAGMLVDAVEREKAVGRSSEWLARFFSQLKVVADELDHWEVTEEPLSFHYVLPRGRTSEPSNPRRLIVEGGRERADRLPSMKALQIYATEITNHPIDDHERILLRVIDLMIVLGFRIGEILSLPLDCWVEEHVRDRSGKIRLDASGKALTRCGIRFFPEKGFDLAIDWIADEEVEVARRAVTELSELCQSARDMARWLHENPTRLWLSNPSTVISVKDAMHRLAYASPTRFVAAMRMGGVHVAARRPTGAGDGNNTYIAGELEAAYPLSRTSLVALSAEGGRPILMVHDALCVKHFGEFAFTQKFIDYWRPGLVQSQDIYSGLGCDPRQPSVFDRRGLYDKGPDGVQRRFKIKPHSLRHLKNAIYDKAGMSDVHQTWAMHRKQIVQTRAYQHPTAAETAAPMRAFLRFAHEDRIKWLHKAVSAGAIAGPVAEAYSSLSLMNQAEAEEFLRTHASAAHVTEYGICTNDFSLEPCRKHLQCFRNCRHYHRTGDPAEVNALRRLRKVTNAGLLAMRAHGEGEGGSGRWIEHAQATLDGIDEALNREPKSSATQVFKDGVDKSFVPADDLEIT